MRRRFGIGIAITMLVIAVGAFGAWSLTTDANTAEAAPLPRTAVTTPQAPLTASGEISFDSIEAPSVGWQVAYASAAVDVYDTPEGTVTETISATATYGSPRAMLVVPDGSSVTGWLRVMLPERWGAQYGWVRAEAVRVEAISRAIHVYVAERQLELVEGDAVLLTTSVAVGTDKTPTPTGVTYVTELLDLSASPSGPYGPFAIALARYSDSFEVFNGGRPQLAIHGTNAPSSIGQNASNGCVRVPNATITELGAQLQLGTPVIIHASRDA